MMRPQVGDAEAILVRYVENDEQSEEKPLLPVPPRMIETQTHD